MFNVADYDYELPESLIAQHPASERDASRLLVLDRRNNRIEHRLFRDIVYYLKEGDLLVINDTKVFPARLQGKTTNNKTVEILLLSPPQPENGCPGQARVMCLAKKSKTLRAGHEIHFGKSLHGVVLESAGAGQIRMSLFWEGNIGDILAELGQTPLPSYIKRDGHPSPEDVRRYQTIFARKTGAVAAPTAGLHFTEKLLGEIKERGVNIAAITLHVGYGTFAPVRVSNIRQHKMHAEYYEISDESARIIHETRAGGNSVVAVGTTTTRALESASDEGGRIQNPKGLTDIFIYPGYKFKAIDHLLTNFHLPRSTLLMLVSALAGREKILRAYQEAVKKQYRFFSYGDAMLIF
ncbi:MAG: tRNA preQ1(34) S-adenosylmethionine ribosyltransferase-isomerase QueA [Deltaproteobacteria bacterium]|nr:tRNA preQ1(34) S-adenosylmethionine ribosyltransferase-isomerase QueA [Deltaproteobacteria bacterium]